MANTEEERSRIIRKIADLAGLGGFIQECVEAEIKTLYPQEVLSIVKPHCPFGPGFLQVADEVNRCYKPGYKLLGISSKMNMEDSFEITEFITWRNDQIARIKTQKVRDEEQPFWEEWNLECDTRRLLNGLSALEERVLFLIRGIDGTKMTPAQVAQLPEFNCSENYIRLVIACAEDALKIKKGAFEEFTINCMQRQIMANSASKAK